MIDLLTYVLIPLLGVIIGLILHESGHYMTASSRGLNPRFGIDHQGLFVKYTPRGEEDRYMVIKNGLLLGYLPVAPLLFYDLYSALIFGIAWSFGSWSEWQELIKIEKRLKVVK